MQLTSRQTEFLGTLVDIYREQDKPVHYVDLAARLGVSKWTAYDMMSVLEKRGAITREYALGERASDGGRSHVMFRPTDKGRSMLVDLAGGRFDDEEWEETKRRILAAVEGHPQDEYRALAEELLQTLDSQTSTLAYWAVTMTALLLTVKDAQHKIQEIPLLRDILLRVRSARARLLALAEVGGSLPRNNLSSVELRDRLEEFLRRHDTLIDQMEAARQRALLGFLGTVMERLGGIG
ncbi:hypothetical protein LLG46_03425 [bacterium]|nr:hypothetical protein [bacterium]